jgi:general secretion pathway protein J
MSTTRDEFGFTLLEVLVSLAILAALLAGLAQATHFGLVAFNSQISAVSRNADLDTVDRTLRTLIGGMDPATGPDKPSLQGGDHTATFVTELPVGAPVRWTHTASVTLLVAGHTLLLRWSEQPHASLLGPAPPVHDEVLMPGVREIGLSYRDANGVWVTSWSQGTLPELVRIHLTLEGKSPRQWPDILIAPMRDGLAEGGE